MRIIAGKHKGRKLFSFEGDKIRPTSDKAREALFAILYNITDKTFLDVCSGTGAIGLEAESRGAIVTMVDNSKDSINLIKKNAKQIESNSQIVFSDAIKFLSSTPFTYDIIFTDPPYDLEIGEQIVKIIKERGLLNSGGVLICEKDKSVDFSYDTLIKVKEKKYGKNIFGFYEEKYE